MLAHIGLTRLILSWEQPALLIGPLGLLPSVVALTEPHHQQQGFTSTLSPPHPTPTDSLCPRFLTRQQQKSKTLFRRLCQRPSSFIVVTFVFVELGQLLVSNFKHRPLSKPEIGESSPHLISLYVNCVSDCKEYHRRPAHFYLSPETNDSQTLMADIKANLV